MTTRILDFESPFRIAEHKAKGLVEITGGDGEGGEILLQLVRRDAIDLADQIGEKVHD